MTRNQETRTQGKPIWYELMTPDAGKVAPFYNAVLGWDIPASGHPMPNGAEYAEIRRADGGHAGGVLKITDAMAAGGMKPAWFPYFHVVDVDEAVSKAEGMGARVHMPASTMDGVGRMAMISDPQGAALYLMDPTPPADNPDAESDVFAPRKAGACWWNELETPDEPEATKFYTSLFGWSAENAMPMGDRGEYRFVQLDGEDLGAINPWMPEGMSPSWLPYFGVENIEAAKAAAEASGGTVTGEIHEVPGGDFIFTATDPAGAHVAFVGPKGA